jgi:hypothetical protein
LEWPAVVFDNRRRRHTGRQRDNTHTEAEFLVAHATCGDLLEVSRAKPGENRIPQLMPAEKNDPVSLMSEELMRGGPHHVYLHAVDRVRDLL